MAELVSTDAPSDPGGSWFGTLTLEPTTDRGGTDLDARVLDAVLRCLGRWGVAKTTLDDIAREAGCSRATVYRLFPGGKDRLLLAAGEREIRLLLAELVRRADAATSLEDALADVLAHGVGVIRSHEVLQYLLEHEPDVVLPHLAFHGLEPLLAVTVGALTPTLERFLSPVDAARTAEWLVRVGLSYSLDHEPGAPGDLADVGDARRFIRRFLLPGLPAVRAGGSRPGPDRPLAGRSAGVPADDVDDPVLRPSRSGPVPTPAPPRPVPTHQR